MSTHSCHRIILSTLEPDELQQHRRLQQTRNHSGVQWTASSYNAVGRNNGSFNVEPVFAEPTRDVVETALCIYYTLIILLTIRPGNRGESRFYVTGKTIATNCAAPSIWCCSYCRCLQFSLEALETGRCFQRDASLSGVQDRDNLFCVVYDILQWNNDNTACTLQQEVYIILSKFFAVKCSNRQLCGLSCPRLLVVYLRISLQCCGSGWALTIVEPA